MNFFHRITEWLRLEGISGGQLVQPFLLDHLQQASQDHVQVFFWYLQGWALNLSGQPLPLLSYPHNIKSFTYVQMRPPSVQPTLFSPFTSGQSNCQTDWETQWLFATFLKLEEMHWQLACVHLLYGRKMACLPVLHLRKVTEDTL